MKTIDYQTPQRGEPVDRWVRMFFSGVVVLCFCIILVGAGHGIEPVGLVLVLGFPEWVFIVGPAWVGITLLFVSDYVASRVVMALGLMLLVGAAAAFCYVSEARDFTIVSSIPFAVMGVVKGFFLSLAKGWRKLPPSGR